VILPSLAFPDLTNDLKIGGSNPAAPGALPENFKKKKTYFLSTQSHGTADNPPKILDIFYSGKQH
jgi:hypothetical protein